MRLPIRYSVVTGAGPHSPIHLFFHTMRIPRWWWRECGRCMGTGKYGNCTSSTIQLLAKSIQESTSVSQKIYPSPITMIDTSEVSYFEHTAATSESSNSEPCRQGNSRAIDYTSTDLVYGSCLFLRFYVAPPWEGTYLADIKVVYLHSPAWESHRKYLRFTVDRTMYQFITLPLGISATSRIFTFILKPVLALLRATGVKLHTYLDKWLGSTLSRLLAKKSWPLSYPVTIHVKR